MFLDAGKSFTSPYRARDTVYGYHRKGASVFSIRNTQGGKKTTTTGQLDNPTHSEKNQAEHLFDVKDHLSADNSISSKASL